MRYVVDASIAVEYLLKTPVGRSAAAQIEAAALISPELMDVEVLSVLRQGVLGGHISESRALAAIVDLTAWPLERLNHRPLLRAAWEMRHCVTAYDALYVAAAKAWDATLLTADARLSRAAIPGVAIQTITLR